MRMRDIPEVEAIERVSFSSPWTRRAYEYDLAENPLAHYVVVREQPTVTESVGGIAPPPPAPATWTERLSVMLASVAGAFHLNAGDRENSASGRETPPVLGFAGIWMAVQEAHLVTIAVTPDWRRRGLGELLLVSVIEMAVELMASSLFLEVRISNLGAKRMYDKYGFVVSRVRKAYYSDNGEDALEMVAEDIDHAQFQSRLQRLKKMLVRKLEMRAPAAEDFEEPI